MCVECFFSLFIEKGKKFSIDKKLRSFRVFINKIDFHSKNHFLLRKLPNSRKFVHCQKSADGKFVFGDWSVGNCGTIFSSAKNSRELNSPFTIACFPRHQVNTTNTFSKAKKEAHCPVTTSSHSPTKTAEVLQNQWI